jgi:hypothetical protein
LEIEMRSSMRLAAAAATVAGLLTARIASGGYVTSQTIVTSGSTVPGSAALSPSNPGEVFGASFSSTPSINDSGSVAFGVPVVFTGNVSSGVLENNYGLFSNGAGALNLLGQAGYLAPTSAGGGTSTTWAGTFQDSFGNPNIDAAGNTAFADSLILTASGGSTSSAGVAITSANSSGIWSDRPGSLSLLAQIGNTALGSPSVTLKTISNLAQNPSGILAYDATTNDSPSTGGVVIDVSGTPAFVARGSALAPGTSGANFSNGTFAAPAINATGQVAFRSSLASGTYPGVTINSTNNQGIWKTVGGTLQAVAVAGTSAPGLAAGDLFGASFTSPDFNNAGQTAFAVSLITGAGDVTSANSGTVWSEGNGSLHLVARLQVTTAPGTNGSVYNSSFGTPVIDDAGYVAFTAAFNGGTGITSANNSGVFSEASGALSLIAQKGIQAPGLPAGVTITSFGAGLGLNALGDLAFSGFLSNGGSALYAQDPSGSVDPLLFTGESFQISPGVFGNVSGFTLVTASGDEDGRASSWNDSDTFAVDVQFNTGGVISSAVVDLTAIPEPSAILGLLVLASPIVLSRRIRRTAITSSV